MSVHRVFYVVPPGEEGLSIREAMIMAEPGDVIETASGVYREQVVDIFQVKGVVELAQCKGAVHAATPGHHGSDGEAVHRRG